LEARQETKDGQMTIIIVKNDAGCKTSQGQMMMPIGQLLALFSILFAILW